MRGVTKHFGANTVVRSASANVSAGQRLCLLGHNGAGKTTLLRLIVGMAYPDEGSVLLMGKNPADDPSSRRCVGYLADKPHLYGKLTAREHLTLHAALYGLAADEVAGRGLRLLDALGMRSAADSRTEVLSLGAQKKLALVLALAHAPRLLVLDEPLNGLDPEAARTMEDLLSQHCASRGAVILSTHSIPFAARFATHYWIMRGGRLRAHAALSEGASGRAPGGHTTHLPPGREQRTEGLSDADAPDSETGSPASGADSVDTDGTFA